MGKPPPKAKSGRSEKNKWKMAYLADTPIKGAPTIKYVDPDITAHPNDVK
jgi:hypothetical protein